MTHFRVLVAGGYGFFGQRLVSRLARQHGLHVLVAGRSGSEGEALVQRLRTDAAATLESVVMDVLGDGLPQQLRTFQPDVLINASGPFQGADYRLPLACIEAGIHYIDLADGRDYVVGIAALHQQALAADVFVTSGASSVPALSGAAADQLSRGMAEVRSIDIGISPGNRTERGLSTVRGILSYCGKPLPSAAGQSVFGWSGSHWHHYPRPVGQRMLSPCDVPDLALFPNRYPGTPDVRFAAGLELHLLHRGMNLMAAMARAGWVRDWSAHALPLKRAADLFRHLGSDAGAMHVELIGRADDGQEIRRTWHLLATEGDGPYVPTLAAAALVRKLRAGPLAAGAHACVGLLSLADFEAETEGLAIRMEMES